MTNIGIIIQARSGSKRFPRKILQKIGGKKIIEHVISRVKKVNFKKKIILATTKKKEDKILKVIAKKNKCLFFNGDENNVLKRFYNTAKKFKIDNIIRISGDSPFIDPLVINRAYKYFKSKKFDVVTNVQHPTYPKGMSVEIFHFKSLEKIILIAKTSSDREHVTKAIYKNTNLFKIKNFITKKKIRKFKFALDYPVEIKKLRKIYYKLVKSKISANYQLKDLVNLAKKTTN